jgi:tRNA dimethylallyltransferase
MKTIVIVGPTGVGKTKLSLELAKRLNGEIINGDSTQVYKDLDIATAKIIDMESINHHLIDIHDVNYDYSVYDFQKDARSVIDSLTKKEKTSIVVGGTGLYIKALLFDYEFIEEKLSNNYNELTDEDLYQRLLKVDPNTSIHSNNRKRVIRALEYYDIHNKPFSEKEKNSNIVIDHILIGLTTDRDNLYNIINKRVDIMLESGLLEEAKRIYDSNIRTKAIMTPIGYKEFFPYFEGNSSLEDCISKIKQNSRKYAKRQYTWFNNQMNVKWFDVDFANFNNTVEEVIDYIKKTY